MNRKVKKYLFDIFISIEEIERFFGGQEITVEILQSDRKTLRAVERDLEIIGEATKRLLALQPTIELSDTRNIIGTRNIIAHEYEMVSYKILAAVLRENLPILKKEVVDLLKNQ